MCTDELYNACKQAWDTAEANSFVDPYLTSPADIDDLAYDILAFGFDDVEALSDDEYDQCVEILKSFLA